MENRLDNLITDVDRDCKTSEDRDYVEAFNAMKSLSGLFKATEQPIKCLSCPMLYNSYRVNGGISTTDMELFMSDEQSACESSCTDVIENLDILGSYEISILTDYFFSE